MWRSLSAVSESRRNRDEVNDFAANSIAHGENHQPVPRHTTVQRLRSISAQPPNRRKMHALARLRRRPQWFSCKDST